MRQYAIDVGLVLFGDHVQNKTEFDSQFSHLQTLVSLAQTFGTKLTLLLSGSFAEMARTENHTDYFTQLLTDGHEIGTYVTPFCHISVNNWKNIQNDLPMFPATTPRNDAGVFRVWADNAATVDSLVGPLNNKTVHSPFFIISLEESLTTTHHFSTSFASRLNKGLAYTGHPVEHPFRPSLSMTAGCEIKENTDTRFVYVDGFLDISNSAKPLTCLDVRSTTIGRAFQQTYNHWFSQIDNRAWSFAFSAHLNELDIDDEVYSVLSTIKSYIGQFTLQSELIARYSTISGMRNNFLSWEAANPPQTSSFSFVRIAPSLELPERAVHVESSPVFIDSLGFRRLFGHVHKPQTEVPRHPAIVIISGDGALVNGLSPQDLARLGYVVIHYDRAGKGHSSGENNYGGLNDQDDLKTVVDYARSLSYVNPDNIGIISFGFNLLVAAGTLHRYPLLNVAYLVDWEGPANKTSILTDRSEDLSGVELSDQFWLDREPINTLKSYTGRYLRLQGAIDHMRGVDLSDAVDMIRAATSSAYGGLGNASLTVLNGNMANRLYVDPVPPLVWLQGESIQRIAEDHPGEILKAFKNISQYARLDITLVVTIPKVATFESDENTFRLAANRLRRLANAFDRAQAKLSIFVENTFVNGTRLFGDDILIEVVDRGHSVGSLIDIPLENVTEASKQRYIADTRTNLNNAIGSVNNITVMGALSLQDPNFLAELGFIGVVGPLLDTPYNMPRFAGVRHLPHNLLRSDQNFLRVDDDLGKLAYLPGDLSKISLPGGIISANLSRAVNSIVISRNLIDADKENSWYIFLDISDFTINEDAEMNSLERWATQDVGLLVRRGEVVWKNANDIASVARKLVEALKSRRPEAPMGLVATPGDHVVELAWEPVVDPSVKGYVIQRANLFYGRNFNTIGSVLQLNPDVCSLDGSLVRFVDPRVENDQNYCYVVLAFTDDNPPIFSAPSVESCAQPRDIMPPPAPCITDSTAGNRTAAIFWSDVVSPDTSAFRIYRRTVDPANPFDLTTLKDVCDLRENFELVAEIDRGTTRYVDSGLTNGQQYTYLVSAVDSSGNEGFDPTCTVSLTPFENLSALPVWFATRLGLSHTEDRGESFLTLNPCVQSLDEAGPVVQFLLPADKAVVSDPIFVRLGVTDMKGIRKIQVGIGTDNNIQICDMSPASPYDCSVDAKEFADGTTVSLFALVTNSIGITTKEAITVTIRDIVGPEITIINPLNGPLPADRDVITSSMVVQVQALDPSGIEQVSISINGGPFLCAKEIDGFWYLPVDVRGLGGAITIVASATDRSVPAHQTITPLTIVTVDNARDVAGPQITVIAPLNGGQVGGVTTFEAEAVDPSGVESVEISFNNGEYQPMSISQEAGQKLILANVKYPYWDDAGKKITFVNSVDNKIYEAGVDSQGLAGNARIIFDPMSVPTATIINAIGNPSFENVDMLIMPRNWEPNVSPDADTLILDTDLPLTSIRIGPGRIMPDNAPIKLVFEAGSQLTEGSPTAPILPGVEFGLFIWHQPSLGGNTWFVAATSNGTDRTIAGAIAATHNIVTLDNSGLFNSTATVQISTIRFELKVKNTLEMFSFTTAAPGSLTPNLARITTQAADGVRAIRVTR